MNANLVQLYARTYSAKTRHVVNPNVPRRTLCGAMIVLSELHFGDDGTPRMADRWMVFGLPACQRCDKSATRRGMVPDTRTRSAESAELQAYVENDAR